MARTESVAVGGYFPTPASQLPRIAGMLRAPRPVQKEGDVVRRWRLCALDPCAGDGAALLALVEPLVGIDADVDNPLLDRELYACELERGRFEALEERMQLDRGAWKRALHGDAFHASFERAGRGVGLLFLNPPYDHDREAGRLEERFLERFTRSLAPGGVLVLVVPYSSLAASAETLARYYSDFSCYRFTGEQFDAYGQVVLFARRTAVPEHDEGSAIDFTVDPAVLARVRAWAADASGIPELPEPSCSPRYKVPLAEGWGDALSDWRMRDVDATALVAKYRPWHESTRGRGLVPIARVLPDLPVAELMGRVYEVATPPRPAHIAAGMAAGLFNGQRIEPDDPASSDLPPLLIIKGVFDREWRTVEEKHNKEGEKTGEVQVQQPKLVVTVLDLAEYAFHTVQASVDRSRGPVCAATMSVADLLAHYGKALTAVMDRQCEMLYDPRRDAGEVEVAESPRALFAAQAHAVRACVTLLRERPGRAPLLLGEIGSGKSTVSLMVGRTIGASRFLVLCPPHLLDTWRTECAAVLPDAEVRVLSSVADVDALATLPPDATFVAVLSREAAKLGHAWQGVGADCPKCGLLTPAGVDLAKKRERCAEKALSARDDVAELARELALQLRPYVRFDAGGEGVLRGRLDKRREAPTELPPYAGLPEDLVLRLRARLAHEILFGRRRDGVKKALAWLHVAQPSVDHMLKFLALAHEDDCYNSIAELLPMLLALGSDELEEARRIVRGFKNSYSYNGTPIERLDRRLKALGDGETWGARLLDMEVAWQNGALSLDGVEASSAEAASRALRCVAELGSWALSRECGEHLYQAVPEPRRFPLARHIVRRHKRLFDFLILDEGHEYANGDSAQGLAAHRLTTLGLPTVLMTGSVMNGYASSLFANLWALSPEFRAEFERGDLSAFCDRYGYRKRFVQDKCKGEVVAFGTQTDRVERSERDTGAAPGVLPLLLFRHLLPSAVTIHKADLRLELPPLTQSRATVEPTPTLLDEYKKLLQALTTQIKADRFKEGFAGKLFGALSELPSYLDRATADVGNGDGVYEIRYPESCGGGLVASARMLPVHAILPKEEQLLAEVREELAEGRNAMVFAWHLGLLPRLQRLLQEAIGDAVPVLYADKVPTGKRQAWIDREVVRKKRRVMVANPVAIQTGLNNLVHFATEFWHENPACNPIVFRQAVGRVDRIGQRLPTRVRVGYYAGTLQEQLYELLMAKVAISTATDGLDPESALRASGVIEDEYLTGLSIGKQLWAMLEETGVFAEDRPGGKRARVA